MMRSYMRATNGGGSLESLPGFSERRAIADRFDTIRLPVPAAYGAESRAAHGIPPQIIPALLGMYPMAAGSLFPIAMQPPPAGIGLESVIGPDDRVMVPDTATVPWRCICHLQMTYENGRTAFGTGWLAGPDTVITAAHCVWDPLANVKAVDIRVTPGRNSSLGPYGQFICDKFDVMEGWPDDRSLDIAAIKLPRDNAMFRMGVGTRLGYFGFADFRPEKLDMLLVNNVGYPLEAAKPFATQWFNGGRIEDVEEGHLTYMIDTEGGQSGSPIFFYDTATGERLVVAVHVVGHYPNRGIRITGKIFEKLCEWVAPSTPPPNPKKRQPHEHKTPD